MHRQPAEWAKHTAVWTAMPSHEEYWEGRIQAAQSAFIEFAHSLALNGGEMVNIWCDGADLADRLVSKIDCFNLTVENVPLGDIWFRDIAPIFVKTDDGQLLYRKYKYNGWGGKYVMKHDDTVSERIAERVGCPGEAYDFVFEGGALDVDGIGTGLTTASCLLNKNRNPEMKQGQIETIIAESLGAETLIWLEDGLLNDHTDGHIDNVARFVGVGRVVCQRPSGKDDPNEKTYRNIIRALNRARDYRGKQLEVIEVPSPGRVLDEDGEIMPASHMNFYIANEAVFVPTYGAEETDAALESIGALFPDRKMIGIGAKGLLYGGGSFHCITQQLPHH